MRTSREERFAALYHDAAGDVLRFCCRRTDREEAQDVTHETFLTAWRRFDAVPKDQGEARAWLFGVARNCLLNSSRSERRRSALGVRISETMSTQTESPEAGATQRIDMATAWRQLADDQQEVLALALWEDLPAAEAAVVLGISAGAYRVRLSRARKALRQLLAASESTRPDPALVSE